MNLWLQRLEVEAPDVCGGKAGPGTLKTYCVYLRAAAEDKTRYGLPAGMGQPSRPPARNGGHRRAQPVPRSPRGPASRAFSQCRADAFLQNPDPAVVPWKRFLLQFHSTGRRGAFPCPSYSS